MTAVTLMVTSKLLFIGGPLGKSSLSGTMASTPLNVRMEGGGEWETQGHLVALSFRPGHPPPKKGVNSNCQRDPYDKG